MMMTQPLSSLHGMIGGKFDIPTGRSKVLLRHCSVAQCVTGWSQVT